jgi:teichoic acid transport system permease protein
VAFKKRDRVSESPVPKPAATPAGLIRLGEQLSLAGYLKDVWRRRTFALENARGELRAQHMDTALGNAWHLLNPVLLIAVYYLVFDVILNATRGVENFIVYLTVGVLAYHWAQKAVTAGASTIVSNEGLIRSLSFPRALLPLSTAVQHTYAFIPSLAVMLVVALAFGERPGWSLALIVPAFVLQVFFITGATLLAARAADAFRDTLNLLPFLFRLVFYGSGILYAVDDRFHDAFAYPIVTFIFIANPFYALVSVWRSAVMSSQPIASLGLLWVSASIWSVAILIIGFVVFRAGEAGYGRA